MFFQRLQRVDSQSADTVNRQPGPEENTAVSQHSLGEPVKDLFIDPAHKTAGQKNQKKITQSVCCYFRMIRYCTNHPLCLIGTFCRRMCLFYSLNSLRIKNNSILICHIDMSNSKKKSRDNQQIMFHSNSI